MSKDSLDLVKSDKDLGISGSIKIPFQRSVSSVGVSNRNKVTRAYSDDVKYGSLLGELRWSPSDVREFIGIRDIDVILGKWEDGSLKDLSSYHPLVKLYGCGKCYARGTALCPFGVKDGELYDNGRDFGKGRLLGYCDDMLAEQLVETTLMGSPDGKRHIRDKNIALLRGLRDRVSMQYWKISSMDSLSKKEVYLLKNYMKVIDMMNGLLDSSFKQDEGSKVIHDKSFSPDDFQKFVQSIDIKGEVIDE